MLVKNEGGVRFQYYSFNVVNVSALKIAREATKYQEN